MKKLLCLLTLTALLSGCAGTYFTFDTARQVQVGMSEAQLQKIMGKPHTITSSAAGEVWVYAYADGFGSARAVSFAVKDGKVVTVPRIPDSFSHSLTGSAVAAP